MGVIKAEIKMETAHEIGCKVDDLLQATEKELHALSGAKTALHQAAVRIEGMQKLVEQDERDGKLTPDQYATAKEWVNRAVGQLRSMAVAAETNETQTRGKTLAYQHVIEAVKKVHAIEKAKATAVTAPEDTVVEGKEGAAMRARTTGQHPGNPLAKRRRRPDLKSVPAPEPESQPESIEPPTPPEVA